MTEVLLVIDVLNDFLDPAGALFCGPQARAIIPVIRSLLDHFQRQGQPIFYLTDAHRPDDAEFALFPEHAVTGSWGSRIIAPLTPPKDAKIIPKTRFSSFYATDLEAELRRVGAERVWVTGVCTSICVMDTVGDLRNRAYTPLVVNDAVADFDQQFHEFALIRMERVYGAKRIRWGDREPSPEAPA